MYHLFAIGSIHRIPNCCGVIELGNLLFNSAGSKKNLVGHVERAGNRLQNKLYIIWQTEEELFKQLKDLLKKIPGDFPGGFYQIWFANEQKYSEYDDEYTGEYYGYGDACDQVRNVLSRLPNVVTLGEVENPNSGNLIDGYIWKKPE